MDEAERLKHGQRLRQELRDIIGEEKWTKLMEWEKNYDNENNK